MSETRPPADGPVPAARLDLLSTPELLRLLNDADACVPAVVGAALPQIARAIEAIVPRLRAGGRLIYVGAGTSGRLGVLDAAECPPTFGVPTTLVQAVIAGGEAALRHAVEGAEDDAATGAAVADDLAIGPADVLIGLAASSRTPYTVAALTRARARGALTVAIGCVPTGPLYDAASLPIVLDVGPEVLAGSTRLKAGTAQKLTLNLISTAVMTQLGHVYDDLMVDVRVTNAKLRRRAVAIVARVGRVDEDAAAAALAAAGDEVKTAIVMLRRGLGAVAATAALATADGSLRRVIERED